MFIPRTIFFDDGDGGGSGDGAGDPNKADPKNDATPKGDPDPNKDTGKPDDKSNVDGKNKKTEPDKPTVESLTATLAERDSLIAKQNKQMGDQSNTIGSFKKIEAMMKSDPAALLENIAAATGKTINIGDGKDKKVDISGDEPPTGDSVLKAMGQMLGEFSQNMKGQFAPALDTINDFGMKQIHEDWDDLKDDRKGFKNAGVSGSMTWNEIFHFAAKGKNVKVAVGEAFEAGKVAGVKELQEQIDAGTARPGSRGSKAPKKEGQDITNALKRMNRIA